MPEYCELQCCTLPLWWDGSQRKADAGGILKSKKKHMSVSGNLWCVSKWDHMPLQSRNYHWNDGLITDYIIRWLSLVSVFFRVTPISGLPCCLPADSATRGGAPQPCPAPHSAPVWAGIVWGWWCSSGSNGLGDEGATPWSSPSGSFQFCGEWDMFCLMWN